MWLGQKQPQASHRLSGCTRALELLTEGLAPSRHRLRGVGAIDYQFIVLHSLLSWREENGNQQSQMEETTPFRFHVPTLLSWASSFLRFLGVLGLGLSVLLPHLYLITTTDNVLGDISQFTKILLTCVTMLDDHQERGASVPLF